MKITRKGEKLTPFDELSSGDVFNDCGGTYMKIDKLFHGQYHFNAIELENGSLASYTNDAPVEKVKAELVIELE